MTRLLRSGASRGSVFGWLLVLVAAVGGAARLGDNSFFTHLTTGRRILDGHLPTTDPYSFTAHGDPWVIQSWLASVIYAVADHVGHGMGIRLLIAGLSGLLAAMIWRTTRSNRSVLARFAAAAPAVLIGTVAWGARPLLFGLLGFVTVLLVLLEERDPRWLVPVMWVWVNTHGSFPLAGVLVLAWGVGAYLDGVPTDHVRRTFRWVVVGILAGAINPLGPKLLWFPVMLLGRQDVVGHMYEWKAPTFTETWQQVFLVALLAAMLVTPRLPEGRRYRFLVPGVLFVALAMTATRNIAIASFLLAPLLAAGLSGVGKLSSRVRHRMYTVACVAVAIVTGVVVGARLAEPSFDFATYPVAAIDQLEREGRLAPPHRIMALDTVGNYLELRTGGTTPVFMDDRVDMYPAAVVDDLRMLIRGGPEWRATLDRWDIDTVVWEREGALASLLEEAPEWERDGTHPDGAGVTWVVYRRVAGPDA